MTVDIYVHLESIRALLLGKDIYICSSLDNEINMHHSYGGFAVCLWVCACRGAEWLAVHYKL